MTDVIEIAFPSHGNTLPDDRPAASADFAAASMRRLSSLIVWKPKLAPAPVSLWLEAAIAG